MFTITNVAEWVLWSPIHILGVVMVTNTVVGEEVVTVISDTSACDFYQQHSALLSQSLTPILDVIASTDVIASIDNLARIYYLVL